MRAPWSGSFIKPAGWILGLLLIAAGSVALPISCLRSRYADSRLQEFSAASQGSIPTDYRIGLSELIPPSGTDFKGAFAVDSPEFAVAFSFAKEDQEFFTKKFTPVPASSLGDIRLGWRFEKEWWPEPLQQAQVERGVLTKSGLVLMTPIEKPKSLPQATIILAADQASRRGYLFIRYSEN